MSNLPKIIFDGYYLFCQSDDHKLYTLVEFNQLFINPVLHNKCVIYYEDNRPIGMVTWAWLSDEEASLFLEEEWLPDEETFKREVGDQLWGMDFITPFGHAMKVMRQFQKLLRHRYGDTHNECHLRRLKTPHKKHTRRF